ncbi:hypothetical protein ACFPRL_34765 [Pseudoclavibacter helvolus]
MAEDKPDRLVLIEQPFLLLHDQLVGVVIGFRRAGRVLERGRLAALDLREVRTSKLARRLRQQLLVARRLRTLLDEDLVEPPHEFTARVVIVRAVAQVAGDLIYEEEAEHLDALGTQHRLLAKVLANRLADHLFVDRAG